MCIILVFLNVQDNIYTVACNTECNCAIKSIPTYLFKAHCTGLSVQPCEERGMHLCRHLTNITADVFMDNSNTQLHYCLKPRASNRSKRTDVYHLCQHHSLPGHSINFID